MIEIGGRKVGWGYSPVVSAELGLNHGADLDRALEMIDKAAEVGVDGVKVQFYATSDFCTDREKEFTYQQHFIGGIPDWYVGPWPPLQAVTEKERDFFVRHEIDLSFVEACYKRAKEHGLIFGVTTTSVEGVAEIVLTDYWKIASDMVHREDMREAMLKDGRPIICALGHWNNGTGLPWTGDRKIYLQCVSEYPAKNPKLWKLTHWRTRNPMWLFGYSHHSRGIEACVRAAELGAVWIEAHFTLDHTLPGSDHFWSLDPQEMKRLVEAIK